MSYETFCECLCIAGFSKSSISLYTSLTIHNKQPYYEDPGGTICYPLGPNIIHQENLLDEVTHLKFSLV